MYCMGLAEKESCLRPGTLHVGVRKGRVYRVLLEGPRGERFAEPEDAAAILNSTVDHGVPTRTRFRRLFNVHEDVGHREIVTSRAFCSYEQIAEAIVEVADTVEFKRGQRRDGRNTLNAPAETSLRKVVTYLCANGVTCEGRLSTYSHWDALVFPERSLIIQSWCATSMGGLEPDQLSEEEALV